jgi:hypothetical protein
MSGLWCWLGNNSSQLQALGNIGAVFVAVALGFVAVRQARAADAQANAARAQVDAANRQTKSSIIVADKQTSPNISIAAASNREGVLLKDIFTILNNGQGRARSLQLRYRDQSVGFEIPLDNSVLVVRTVCLFALTAVGVHCQDSGSPTPRSLVPSTRSNFSGTASSRESLMRN